MNSKTASSSRPLYSPKNPVLRGVLVTLIAGFVVSHEAFTRLFKANANADPHTLDDSIARLSHTVR